MELNMGSQMIEEQDQQADIISSLPDEVLVHIISHLPIVYAVRTCLLSSRWKNLWLHIYNFEFDYDPHPCHSRDGPFIYAPERRMRFATFVARVISLCQSDNIQNFNLKCDGPTFSPRINTWINFALNRNVHNIYLRIDNGGKRLPSFPQAILTCKTLVKLSVYTDFSLDIPDSNSFLCFPSLKSLSFHLYHTDSDLIQKIFRGCPVLEELSFEFYRQHINMLTFNIFIPTLKRLYISSDHKFVVRTPNLEYLNIISSQFYLGNEMPFVSEAFVKSKQFPLLPTSTAEANCAMQLLRGINCIKFLTLSSCTMQALCLAFDGDFPTFPDLKHLTLESGARGSGWKLLPHFLSNSPNLEVLKLNVMYRSSVSVDFDKQVPSCLMLRLKVIEMYYRIAQFKKVDLEVAKYLLKSSEVLEKFRLHCSAVSKTDVSKSIREKIDKCPKGSKACNIIIN